MDSILTTIMNLLNTFFNSFKSNPAVPPQPVVTSPVVVAPIVHPIQNQDIKMPDTSIYSSITMIPPRPADAMTGTDFIKTITNVIGKHREDLILAEFVKGNMPSWIQNFVEINISDGTNSIKYFVMPDVLCIGSDNDFLRISASGYTYKKIADLFGFSMITNKMSKQIWEAADLKLTPITWPGPFTDVMGATSTIVWHHNAIEKQRAGRGFKLITGHKKDMVLSKDLLKLPNNICITGWYYPNGKQIQPKESRVHSEAWVDYADEVRLVNTKCFVNGQLTDIYSVLNDATLCTLISDEGNYDAKEIYKIK